MYIAIQCWHHTEHNSVSKTNQTVQPVHGTNITKYCRYQAKRWSLMTSNTVISHFGVMIC